eukprot:TRINITY_DN14142_c0_g1_i3.p1 TRINITY_DN14142_c0_g1~~TRINITY_DN14142_c0_g1_i3.p1  ORF type:complete len:236 (-),score=37.20 TRINITY_DN14142_c0_g1_i3:20-727(-)
MQDEEGFGDPNVSIFFENWIVNPYKWAYGICGLDILLTFIVMMFFAADFDTNYSLLFWTSLSLFLLTASGVLAIRRSFNPRLLLVYKVYAIYRFVFYIYASIFSALFLFVLSTTDFSTVSSYQPTDSTKAMTSLVFAVSLLNIPLAYIQYKCYRAIKEDKIIKDTVLTNLNDIVTIFSPPRQIEFKGPEEQPIVPESHSAERELPTPDPERFEPVPVDSGKEDRPEEVHLEERDD